MTADSLPEGPIVAPQQHRDILPDSVETSLPSYELTQLREAA